VEPIAELMDEHFELLELSGEVRRLLASGDRAGAWRVLGTLAQELVDHVGREEDGVFRALRDQGDFVDEVLALEGEHVAFDEDLSDLDLAAPDLEARVEALLDELSLHIDKENLGIFPVAVVTLGAAGWETVAAAHARTGAGVA
jgi:hemerythrin-like domain-containing protein